MSRRERGGRVSGERSFYISLFGDVIVGRNVQFIHENEAFGCALKDKLS